MKIKDKKGLYSQLKIKDMKQLLQIGVKQMKLKIKQKNMVKNSIMNYGKGTVHKETQLLRNVKENGF